MPRAPANALIAALLALIVSIYVSAGLRGVGFGSMWDESHQIEGLRRSIQTVSITETGYYYGGLYYVPGYVVLAPKLLTELPAILDELRDQPSRPFDPTQYPSIVAFQRKALDALDASSFLEQDRRVFVWLVALTIPCVFALCYLACGSRWAALAGAAAVGLSWELSYHGRWIAVDSLLGLCCALVLLGSVAALGATTVRVERRYFRLAAVAAGLGLGCKMPGVFLLVPLLAARAASLEAGGIWGWCKRATESCFVALAVFVATSPGVVLDPLHYANDMFRVTNDYNLISDDYPYCEPEWTTRLGKIASYCGTVLFSPYWPIALGLALLAGVGVVIGFRERRPKVLVTLCFLLVYSAFVSAQRLLIVRNLMVTLPPLALLVSVGCERVLRLAQRQRLVQLGLVVSALAAAALNASWITRSAQSIGTTTDASILRQVAERLRRQAAGDTYVSPEVMAGMRRHDAAASALVSAPWATARNVVMYADAVPGWHANTARYATYFGSLYANYDYYPGLLLWSGLKKTGAPVMLLSKANAVTLGIKTAPAR